MADVEKELLSFLNKNFIQKPEVSFKSFVSDRMEVLLNDTFKKESDIYRRGNIDRKVYYNLKHGDDNYRPTKAIALSYCLALGLGLKEAEKLLYLGGYHFEPNSLTDQIVRYCLNNRIYSANIANSYISSCRERLHLTKVEYIGSHARDWYDEGGVTEAM